MKESRIIFLGTPEFAVAPLDHLVKKNFNIIAVVTAQDKPAGRGKKLKAPPVKIYAEEKGIPVFQPERLKDEEFLTKIKKLQPDIMVVVAFRMMPRELWSIPRKGTFNLHASLLPQYRGAAPINHAIMNGETETGLTTFFIDEKIDTGEIILNEKMQIGVNETAGELHDRMMKTGSGLVEETILSIETGSLRTQPQPSSNEKLKPAPKIYKEDCKIDWSQKGEDIHNHIRGLSPYPAAFTFLIKEGEAKIQIKILRSVFRKEAHNYRAGRIFSDGKTFLKVAVKNGYIDIQEIQPAGKKAMKTKDFLNGFQHPEKWKMDS